MRLSNVPGYSTLRQLRPGVVFCLLWLLLFVLYFPAAKAGYVTDYTGWLDQIKNHSFSEYVNRTNFNAKSLYQFTQLVTYFFYKLFGINPWLWHLLFVTLHAINATLLFIFCTRLLNDSGVANGKSLSAAGALLFCVSPYMSEVVVWEPSFHYLQGLLIILLVLLWAQRFLHTGSVKYVLGSLIIYFLSTFSLEIFYTTPWLVLMLGLFYRFSPAFDKRKFGKLVLYFFVPMLLLFFVRLVIFRVAYGGWVSRIGTDTVTAVSLQSFGKPAKYLFHILFLGRFFSKETRDSVYAFCESLKGVVLFYGIMSLCGLYIIARFRNMSGRGKVASLLFIYMSVTLALMIPLWFGNMQLVIFDRYDYFTCAFLYLLLGVLAGFISSVYLRTGIIGVYALLNLRFAVKMSRYWGKSYRIDQELLTHVPDAGNKIILLLNLPENMNGIPMIGAGRESEYKLMHNLLLPDKPITNPVYDVLSYNMLTPDDGAHVTVANDSVLHITLNQWATWWWMGGMGAYSYETPYFKVNLIDEGHWYELTLKKPAADYLLLYEADRKWKVVDMNNRSDQY